MASPVTPPVVGVVPTRLLVALMVPKPSRVDQLVPVKVMKVAAPAPPSQVGSINSTWLASALALAGSRTVSPVPPISSLAWLLTTLLAALTRPTGGAASLKTVIAPALAAPVVGFVQFG